MSIEDVHKALVGACVEIGQISECNYYYTFGLARIISELGKSVDDLTVAELLLLNKQYTETFNRLYSKSEA